jgi:hypothetical protein
MTMSELSAFEPTRFLTKVNGRDYLEVKWRLVWLRSQHPEARIETELVHHDPNSAVFRAQVTISGSVGNRLGRESSDDFHDFLDKARRRRLVERLRRWASARSSARTTTSGPSSSVSPILPSTSAVATAASSE